jgi:hypothetical protein
VSVCDPSGLRPINEEESRLVKIPLIPSRWDLQAPPPDSNESKRIKINMAAGILSSARLTGSRKLMDSRFNARCLKRRAWSYAGDISKLSGKSFATSSIVGSGEEAAAEVETVHGDAGKRGGN